MGIKKSFIPKKNFNNLTLTTELFVDDKLVETSHTKYKCEELNQELCAAEAMEKVGTSSRTMMYIVIAVALLVLLVAILAYHGHLKRKDVGVASFIFLGTISIGMYQLQAKLVDAAILDQATEEYAVLLEEPTYSATGYYMYNSVAQNDALTLEGKNDLGLSGTVKNVYVTKGTGPRNPGGTRTTVLERNSLGFVMVNDLIFQYNYGAEMRNAVTNAEIPKGATIPAGTRVKFVPVPFNNNHIGWYLTGNTLDSPYGYWNNPAGNAPVPKCQPADKFATQRFQNGVVRWNPGNRAPNATFDGYTGNPTFDLNINAYLPIVVDQPVVSVDTDGSTASITDNGDGTYTVNSPGVIKGTVIFAPTTARAYYQYTTQNLLNQGIDPILTDSKFVDFAPGQEAELAAIPEGTCQTFTTFPFQTEEKEITLTANVVEADFNRPPPPPTFTMSGRCQNVPITGAASPVVDPDGDAVSYQYAYSYGSTFTPWQTISNGNVGFTFTPTFVATYTVRMRAVDSKGLPSAYTSKTVVVSNCNTVSAYCTDPTLVGNKPQWEVTAYSSNPTVTYTYTWSWPSRPYTLVSPNILQGNNELAPGSSATGPTVTVTPSSGAAQTLNCATATRPRNSSGRDVSGYCYLLGLNENVPTWKAVIKDGWGPYNYNWHQPSRGTVNGNEFTLDRAVTLDETISDITVNIVDDRGEDTGTLSCESVSIVDSPSVVLTLSDVTGRKQGEVTVKQNQVAFAYTATNRIVAAQCSASKIKTSNGSFTNPSWGATGVNFATYGGLSALSGFPLDTSEVGVFDLTVTCPVQGNTSAPPESSTAKLRVVVDPDLKEF